MIKEGNIPDSMQSAVEYYVKKYNQNKTIDNGTVYEYKKNIEKPIISELFQLKFTKIAEYRTNQHKNIVFYKRLGRLNTKAQDRLTIYQYGIYGDYEKKFNLETLRMKKLGKHDNIIKVYGFFHYRLVRIESFFVITERETNSLAEQLNNNTEINILQLAKDTLNALAYIENLGISHRRINPKNIFYIDGKYKISVGGDMVIIKEDSADIHYLAPEIKNIILSTNASSEKIRFIKSDVYSYGLTLFKAYTKENYEGSKDLEKIKDSWLFNILIDTLKINPNERPLFKNLVKDLQRLSFI